MPPLRATDLDFHLPPEQIARVPPAQRGASRLMLLGPDHPTHHAFSELPSLIERALGPTLLVLNDSRVIPARLFGRKPPGPGGAPGGRVELLVVEPAAQGHPDDGAWRCLYRASKPLRPGQQLQLDSGADPAPVTVTVLENEGGGKVRLRFDGLTSEAAVLALLERLGRIPLPPYIVAARRDHLRPEEQPRYQEEEDRRRYQTVYAERAGSVAAPTAGLHFTTELLQRLRDRGVDTAPVTLHVGPGTFAPLLSDDPAAHPMHAERFHIPEETSERIRRARAEGRKVLAVGTTVVRTLESATPEGQRWPTPGPGESRLFIYPPYRFRAVDALLTNFHLPRSTLLLLVAALAGPRRLLAAYQEAIRGGYRFFSYGDCMLIPHAMEDPA